MQSKSRATWVVAKLGLAVMVAVTASVGTGLAMKALWRPVSETTDAGFTGTGVFDSTGPVAVAYTLLTLVVGATAGLLLRRTLPAMATTLGVFVAVKVAMSSIRLSLGSTVTRTTGGGHFLDVDRPEVPNGALEIDTSHIASDGSLHGWGTCTTAKDVSACLRDQHITGWSVKYLPVSQMAPMQWLAAGILTALLLAVGRRHRLRGPPNPALRGPAGEQGPRCPTPGRPAGAGRRAGTLQSASESRRADRHGFRPASPAAGPLSPGGVPEREQRRAHRVRNWRTSRNGLSSSFLGRCRVRGSRRGGGCGASRAGRACRGPTSVAADG
ncbi:hypothetical protein ABT275_43695 [Streptomyces sp. NPDC001185]|uniref:hypothetical protein n=1 Tax=Streptomyces sp. NPDC001185 TaxID=3154380 RepID=UPI00332D5E59